METALVAHTNGVTAWTADQVDLVKRTVAKGASTDELSLFLHVAKRTGLDPFARQIYCIQRGGRMTIQTGIDGYRLIADRTGLYAGSDAPIYDTETESHPGVARVTVYKFVGGQRCAFTAPARWSEYAQHFKGQLGDLWQRMPYLMLGKCAEALALRKAFPQELSGLYTREEMLQAETDDTAQVVDEIEHLLSVQGVAEAKRTAWWEKMHQRHGFPLTKPQLLACLDGLQKAAAKKAPSVAQVETFDAATGEIIDASPQPVLRHPGRKHDEALWRETLAAHFGTFRMLSQEDDRLETVGLANAIDAALDDITFPQGEGFRLAEAMLRYIEQYSA